MTDNTISARSNSNSSKVILLVGAGISVPANIPAMRGMYKAFQNRAYSNITPEEKSICRFITEKLGVAEDLEEFLITTNAIEELKYSSLETLVEQAVSNRKGTKNLLKFKQQLNARTRGIGALQKRIMNFMSETCFRFDRDKAFSILGNFVEAVSKQGYPIYSTNYDAVLEEVALEREIPIEDNFPVKGRRLLWSRDIHFPLGGALTLIKMHGSVTWYVDKDGNVEKMNSNTNINLAGKDVKRRVIFPTRFKDIYGQHFFALYHHFLFAVSNAEVLIIIGHSLRDEYIRAAIIERARKPDFHIVIINPDLPSKLQDELQAARSGKNSIVTHIPLKFEDLSGELSKILLTSSPSQIGKECATIVQLRKSK